MIFFVLLQKELLELWRTYRLIVVAIVMIAFGLLSPLFAAFTPQIIRLIPSGEEIAKLIPPPTALDAVTQYLKNIGQFGILLALLLTMGSIAQEKDKGTAAMMLTKPLPRGAWVSAKFTAFGLMFSVCIGLAGLGCYYYTMILFKALDIQAWLLLNCLIILEILVYVALTLMCSTFTRSQVVAGGITLGILLGLSLFGAIPGIGQYLPGELPNWGGRLMTGDWTPSWSALWISLVIIIASLVTAWLVFRRQEI